MTYEKEQALLAHYNKYPEGGTTLKDPQTIRIVFDLAGILPIEGAKILDLGCASGVMADHVMELYNVDVTGVDSAFSRIVIGKRDRPKVDYIEYDLHKFLDTTNLTFDVIMMFDLIEHLEDPKETVAQARKILKPHGKILTKTPLNFPYEAHLQVYKSKEDFDERMDPTKSFLYGQSIVAIWEP